MMLYLSLLLLWIPWWLINNRKREVNKITSERTNSVGALATTGGLIMYDLAIYRSLPLYDMINAVIPDAPMIILSPILALSVSWVVRVILSWMWPTMAASVDDNDTEKSETDELSREVGSSLKDDDVDCREVVYASKWRERVYWAYLVNYKWSVNSITTSGGITWDT